MSDDFDREAERRKLEEKFGEDEADREQTERLSELLLKGATMTDIHCPECGDPIFRHEGRQFCPSCQREVAGGQGQQATAGQAAAQDPLAADEQAPEPDAAPDPTTDGHAAAESPAEPDESDQSVADEGAGLPGAGPDSTVDAGGAAADADPAGNASGPEQGTPRQQAGEQSASATSQGGAGATGPATQSPTPPQTGGTAAGLMPARQHLTQTVNRLAEQAAAEEDPGRKREFLAATREAAEALAAVRDAE